MKRLRVAVYLLACAVLVGSLSGQAQSPAVHGSGASNYVPLWLDPSILGNSNIYQSGLGHLGVGTTTPGAALDVNGAINAATSFNLGGARFAFGSLTLYNVGLGNGALQNNSTGSRNTALGYQALPSNTTGVANTAVGAFAAFRNTGSGNTAVGESALHGYEATGAVDGSLNTAVGAQALFRNTTGANNTAVGWYALLSNTTGAKNAATGHGALMNNATGNDNSAHGYLALYNNTTGQENNAQGSLALYRNTTGYDNTAIGNFALWNNNTGNYNTALGAFAGPDPSSTNLTNATAIGAHAVVSASNAMVLGSPGVRVGIGTATPGNVFTIAQGAGVAISDGWIVYSSRRLKTNIRTLQGALGKVEQLRGVSYDVMANGKHEVGVIAEEVGAVVPEVVSWDQNGQDARGVDYSRLTALLIEATKQQQALIREQQKQMKDQQTQIADLASQIETIRASLASSSR